MKIILLVLLSFFIIGCEDDRTEYIKYNKPNLKDHTRVKDYWYNNYREIIIRNETTGEIFLEVKGKCGYERRGDVVTVTCATTETEFKEYIATLVPNMSVLVITDLKE